MGTEDCQFTNRKKRRGSLARPRWLLAIVPLCFPAVAWAEGPIPDQTDCDTPLIAAIHRRDLSEVRRIVDSGADLNVKACEEGVTALIESIAVALPQVAKDLVLAGADPNVASNHGGSPLMQAAWYCRDEVVSLLLKKGAAVNATDTDGYTALMHAASHCADGKIVAILLRAGAGVNVKSKTSETALTVAAFNGVECAVKELVAAGADLSAKTDEGETALTIARDRVVGRKPAHDRIYAFLLGLAER